MSMIYQRTEYVIKHLEGLVGEIEAKNFFSYYALFHKGLMFGLYKDEKFYLRIPEQYLNDPFIKSLNRLNDSASGIHNKNFYHLPHDLIPNTHLYSHFLQSTLVEISTQKRLSSIKRRNHIRSLKNLNISIERLLRKIGILTIKDFMDKNPCMIYAELIKKGIEADKNLLFKLYGAAYDFHIYTMSPEQKNLILEEADQALYNIGLRKRFKINW